MIIACKIDSVQPCFCNLLHAIKYTSTQEEIRARELCSCVQKFQILCTLKPEDFCRIQACSSLIYINIYRYIHKDNIYIYILKKSSTKNTEVIARINFGEEEKMEQKNDKDSTNEKVANFIAEEQAKTAKTILAVDLGANTGWAISNEFGITSGSVSFKQDRFCGGGMRFLHFQKWLEQLPKVDVVYFEEVRRHLGVDAAHSYGGFLSHLTSWCEMRKTPYQGIPVGTIKRFITGKGNASKEEVITAIKALGNNPGCDNEADALALLHFAMQQVSSAIKISGGKR